MRTKFFILLFLALILTGCQAGSTTKPVLTLEPCTLATGSINAECGYLKVPEDRSNPNSRMLDLGIVVVRAWGSNKASDPLFYIAGGPGNAATSSDIVSSAVGLFSEVNVTRDIVYLDQRGTNGKHQLSCAYPSVSIADASQQEMDDWMKQCLAGLDGDPRFYTTAEAMRDLDDARAALGYNKINLYGISYGAMAIQVYMRMFPKHVRTAVLDHGTALNLAFFLALPRASQSALDQIFTYCDNDEKCHTAYPDIRADWKAVIDRLAKGPVVTDFIPPNGTAAAQVDIDGFVEAIHSLMFNSGTYMKIPFLIHLLAVSEDWTPIVKSLSQQYGSSASDNQFLFMKDMIFCFEPAWQDVPGTITQFSQGSYMLDLQVKYAQNEQKICAVLPKPDASSIYGPGKPAALSALMFNSLIDPQNPPANMDPALKEFTKSRMIVEKTEGHNTTAFPSCRWNIMAQYIQSGTVDGLDTSCVDKQKPSFVVGN